MRCRVWECTSCRSPLERTGWTLLFPLPLMERTAWQEMSEEYQDPRRPVRMCLLLLPPPVSFNFPKRSPADTTLAIYEQTAITVIPVTQSFRSCGRTARTSGSQHLLRLADLGLGSESPLKARLYRPVGTVLEDLVTPPIVQVTTPAGERGSRWRKDWAQGSATRQTVRGATSTIRPSRRAQDRLRTQTSRPSCAMKYWTIPTTGRIASTTWIRRRLDCAQVGAANLMMTASLPTSRGLRRE